MSTRRTIVYGVLFAVLVAAYVGTGRIQKKIVQERYEAKKLFSFEADEIRTLSIEQEGVAPVEAMRDDDGRWSIVTPYDHIAANGPFWDQLAEIAAAITNERPIQQNSSGLEAFNLESPPLVIRIGTNNGELTQLGFGDIDPTRRHRYAVRGTNPDVFLVNAQVFGAFNRRLDDLRDRRVFPGAAQDIDAIEFRLVSALDDDGNVTGEYVERYALDDEGVWWVEEPIRAQGNQKALKALADEILLLQAAHFNDDPESLADYGLDKPYATLTPFAQGQSAGTLAIGWADEVHQGTFFSRISGSPSVFSVDAYLIALLPSEPLEFREKHLFTGEAVKLERIVYKDRSNEWELRYVADGGWRMTRPAVTDSDQLAITFYVTFLKQLQGRQFQEDLSDTGLDSPRSELSLYTEGNAQPTFIRIGNAVPDSDPLQFYAATDFGLVTAINLNDLRLLEAAPFTFRQKQILSFEPQKARILNITLDGETYSFVRSRTTWHVVKPEEHRIESQSDIGLVLNLLSGLKATGIVDPVPSREVMGLDSPVLTAMVHMESDAVGPLSLGNLKASASRERFAQVEGQTETYYLDQSILDDIREIFKSITPMN